MAMTVGVQAYFDGKDLMRGLDSASKAVRQVGGGFSQAKEGAQKFGAVLSTLGGIGGDTGKILGGMISGFAGGGLMGIAIAGVQSLASALQAVKAEQEAIAKKARDFSEGLAKTSREAVRQLHAAQAEAAGAAGVSVTTKALKELEEKEAKLNQARNTLQRLQLEAGPRTNTVTGKVETPKVSDDLQKRLAQAQKDFANAQAEYEAFRATTQIEAQKADAAAEEQRRSKAEAAQAKLDAKRRASEQEEAQRAAAMFDLKQRAYEIDKEAADERSKIEIDSQKRIADLEEKRRIAEKKGYQDQVDLIDTLIVKERAAGEARLATFDFEAAEKALDKQAELLKQIDTEKKPLKQATLSPRDQISNKYDTQIAEARDSLDMMERVKAAGGGDEFDAQIAGYKELIALAEEAKQKELFDFDSKKLESQLQPIGAMFQNVFDRIIQGGASMKEIMVGLFQQMASMIVGELIKMAIQAIITHALQKPAKMGEVSAAAGVAGANAAAAMAGIPIVGPALAAAAMAQTSALVLGSMMPLAAAARGFDIPQGVNPITQLHQKEMVLPAIYADRIRDMTEMPRGTTNNYVINAMDGKDVQRVLRSNAKAVTKTIRREQKGRRF